MGTHQYKQHRPQAEGAWASVWAKSQASSPWDTVCPSAAHLDWEEAEPHGVYRTTLHHVIHAAEIVHHLSDFLGHFHLF